MSPPIKLTAAQLQPIIDAFVTFGESRAARELGLPRGTFRSRLSAARAMGLVGQSIPPGAKLDVAEPTIPSVEPRGKEKVWRSFDDFVKTHDVNLIIHNQIKSALRRLGDNWLPEEEFRKFAEVNASVFPRYREQFADHIVEVKVPRPGRIWVGSTLQAEQFRKRVAS